MILHFQNYDLLKNQLKSEVYNLFTLFFSFKAVTKPNSYIMGVLGGYSPYKICLKGEMKRDGMRKALCLRGRKHVETIAFVAVHTLIIRSPE